VSGRNASGGCTGALSSYDAANASYSHPYYQRPPEERTQRMTDQPIMEFTSHVAGANAKVAIYADRIEWSRKGLKPAGGVTGALLTGGLSLALPGRKDTNMIPVRQIQGVSTHRAGLSYTTVRVATAGDVTEFRVSKSQAENVKATLLRLMSGPATAPGAPSAPPSGSLADELRKLAELRDAGVLTAAEFDAQKARLLG
jgi:hypothetical protein